MSPTVAETIEYMRSIGAVLKAESYADDEGKDIVAVVYADGKDAAARLLRAFEYLEIDA